MATKNKKDITAAVLANLDTNTTRDITAVKARVPHNDIINSMSVNITVAQLQAEDASSEPSLANIIDSGKQGIFAYDPLDVTSADDGGGAVIVTAINQRFKRVIDKAINAKWYGQANYYFPDLATAKATVKAVTRFVGLEITILLNGSIETFWFSGGILDANLVIKKSEPHPIDFTVGDGGALTPADGTADYIDPVLAGATILGFWAAGRKIAVTIKPAVKTTPDAYATFDKPNNKISWLNGGAFTQDIDYSILYK